MKRRELVSFKFTSENFYQTFENNSVVSLGEGLTYQIKKIDSVTVIPPVLEGDKFKFMMVLECRGYKIDEVNF